MADEELIREGRVWVLGDDISTDLMMPGEVMRLGGNGHRECFRANRPGWVDQVREDDLIIGGRNYGCGSSRAAHLNLLRNGIRGVVAESLSRIFFRNAINGALPVLTCQGVSKTFTEGDIARVNFTTGVVENLTKGTSLQGIAFPPDSPPMEILRVGGLTQLIKQELERMK
ncbi:MAG: 3-isopropylmalate dehydratase [Dehalococcoidia bacterium]|nr:3-isopropylmalate dehydratase [Dehalococcoidia bacterium]